MSKIIICILCLTPDETYLEFVSLLNNEKYSVYICVDDNEYIPDDKWLNKLNFIQEDNLICEKSGYNSVVGYFNNKSCSKDKALYYFNNNNIDYEYIWLIEDDAFIPSLDTIKNIDCKYKKYDFLTPKIDIINIREWWWGPKIIHNQFNSLLKKRAEGIVGLPGDRQYSNYFNYLANKFRFRSMTCAIRLSKKFMTKIDNFASNYNRLFMDELFFVYIATMNNLLIKETNELNTILYNKDWKYEDININNLYHPIKSYELQKNIRDKLHNYQKRLPVAKFQKKNNQTIVLNNRNEPHAQWPQKNFIFFKLI